MTASLPPPLLLIHFILPFKCCICVFNYRTKECFPLRRVARRPHSSSQASWLLSFACRPLFWLLCRFLTEFSFNFSLRLHKESISDLFILRLPVPCIHSARRRLCIYTAETWTVGIIFIISFHFVLAFIILCAARRARATPGRGLNSMNYCFH